MDPIATIIYIIGARGQGRQEAVTDLQGYYAFGGTRPRAADVRAEYQRTHSRPASPDADRWIKRLSA